MRNNPFTPTFGAQPPIVVGIDALIEDFAEALDTGPGHPERTIMLFGPRGAGKTVALNQMEDVAASQGWLIISEDASRGVIDRIRYAARDLFLEQSANGHTNARRISVKTSLSDPAGILRYERTTESAGTDTKDELPPLRQALNDLAELLDETGTGVFVTIDEVQALDAEDAAELGNAIQHVGRRSGLPVAFAAAGLPSAEEGLLKTRGATFLQRASRFSIGRLHRADVVRAIREPMAISGASIEDDALSRVVDAAAGFAFMVQLVGFHCWAAATDQKLDSVAVAAGIERAESRVGRLVLEPIWNGLSEVDRHVLMAMAQDDPGPSKSADIGQRLGKGGNYVAVYRDRLIKAGLIEAAGRGRVDFVHAATRSWLLGREG